MPPTHLRKITANQLLFISHWSSSSVYHMEPAQQDKFFTALTSWHEAHAEQALTGENPMKAYMQSDNFTDHLKEFWDAITHPSITISCAGIRTARSLYSTHTGYAPSAMEHHDKDSTYVTAAWRPTNLLPLSHTTKTSVHWWRPNKASY